MTWKFVGQKNGLEPLPGLPLEASDAEWNDAMKAYEANGHHNARKAVEASGIYQHSEKAAASAEEG